MRTTCGATPLACRRGGGSDAGSVGWIIQPAGTQTYFYVGGTFACFGAAASGGGGGRVDKRHGNRLRNFRSRSTRTSAATSGMNATLPEAEESGCDCCCLCCVDCRRAWKSTSNSSSLGWTVGGRAIKKSWLKELAVSAAECLHVGQDEVEVFFCCRNRWRSCDAGRTRIPKDPSWIRKIAQLSALMETGWHSTNSARVRRYVATCGTWRQSGLVTAPVWVRQCRLLRLLAGLLVAFLCASISEKCVKKKTSVKACKRGEKLATERTSSDASLDEWSRSPSEWMERWFNERRTRWVCALAQRTDWLLTFCYYDAKVLLILAPVVATKVLCDVDESTHADDAVVRQLIK